ncbi:hypothetical protein PYW07_006391 [Mythimna separata]|uniref:Fucosyltransferase n=1 Tax=Mythimna separata TaxID=271217 RepID=A0AAD7YUM5_MYTSE|nr:hypothetical protein PYW07_006391 [Mythimna separata]
MAETAKIVTEQETDVPTYVYVFFINTIPRIWRLAHNKLTNAARRRTDSEVAESKYEATDDMSRTQASCHRCHLPLLRPMRSVKFFFLVTCTSFAFSLFWLQLATTRDERAVTESLVHEALENVGRDYRYKDVYRKPDSLPKDFKYILLWTNKDYAPFYYFGNGQRMFLKNNCSVTKCYVTGNRSLFGGDLTKFDAIAFNGRNMKASDLPKTRSPHQKYIFFNMESAVNYPVCDARFDDFFNWTATYRLNSDISFTYMLIRDKEGRIVGPKRKMRWKEDVGTVKDDFIDRIRIQNKTKAAAWFVSNCKTRSGRQGYAKALMNALKPYGFTVDVYGLCGTLQCPRNGSAENCNSLLKNDYYFYLSLENSFDEDYVTEKLLTALDNDVIPIVYGGADYSRFLPPGSYLDGRKQHVVELAAMMNNLIHSPKQYNKYFRWKHHYTYNNPTNTENVCAVCQALHDKKMLQKKTNYKEFRRWWLLNYETRCPKPSNIKFMMNYGQGASKSRKRRVPKEEGGKT